MHSYEDHSATVKRFVKKIPTSGSAPAYKLTIPFSFCSRHALHLVDSSFELASHPDAVHTWSASIVPRRNKDRSEYTLQGWRLWAEAHNIQAGDQVSFELVTPRKMILQVIRPDAIRTPDPMCDTSRVRKLVDLQQAQLPIDLSPPSKSPRTSEQGSPSQVSAMRNSSAEMSVALLNDDLVDGLDLSWQLLHDDIGTSLHMASLHADNDSCQNMPESSFRAENSELKNRENFMSTPVPATPSVKNVTSGQMRSSASDTLMASTSASLSQSYHDSPPQTRAHLPHIFSGVLEDEARAEPVAAPCGSPAMRSTTASMISRNSSLVDCASRHGVHGQAAFDRQVPQAPKVEDVAAQDADYRKRYQTFQSRLDGSTRSAMKAAMGLEKCITEIATGAMVGRKRQEDLFSHLSILKSNLWQMLVLSMPEETA